MGEIEPSRKQFLEDLQCMPITDKRRQQLEEFCGLLGIHMDHLELLDRALTHTSFAHEKSKIPNYCHNERLEFLGDSVLSLIVSTYIFGKYRRYNEGWMTKRRAQVVCEKSLYNCASKYDFGTYMNLGWGEVCTGGRERPSILADAFEAVLGAYYLDQGYLAAKEYLLRLLQNEIDEVCEGIIVPKDFKSRFQEMVQGGSVDSLIRYETIGFHGPEHDRIFKAAVFLNEKELGVGEGRTKKEAEQQAAKAAIELLSTESDSTPK